MDVKKLSLHWHISKLQEDLFEDKKTNHGSNLGTKIFIYSKNHVQSQGNLCLQVIFLLMKTLKSGHSLAL